jgi:hypothetical protein
MIGDDDDGEDSVLDSHFIGDVHLVPSDGGSVLRCLFLREAVLLLQFAGL